MRSGEDEPFQSSCISGVGRRHCRADDLREHRCFGLDMATNAGIIPHDEELWTDWASMGFQLTDGCKIAYKVRDCVGRSTAGQSQVMKRSQCALLAAPAFFLDRTVLRATRSSNSRRSLTSVDPPPDIQSVVIGSWICFVEISPSLGTTWRRRVRSYLRRKVPE